MRDARELVAARRQPQPRFVQPQPLDIDRRRCMERGLEAARELATAQAGALRHRFHRPIGGEVADDVGDERRDAVAGARLETQRLGILKLSARGVSCRRPSAAPGRKQPAPRRDPPRSAPAPDRSPPSSRPRNRTARRGCRSRRARCAPWGSAARRRRRAANASSPGTRRSGRSRRARTSRCTPRRRGAPCGHAHAAIRRRSRSSCPRAGRGRPESPPCRGVARRRARCRA